MALHFYQLMVEVRLCWTTCVCIPFSPCTTQLSQILPYDGDDSIWKIALIYCNIIRPNTLYAHANIVISPLTLIGPGDIPVTPINLTVLYEEPNPACPFKCWNWYIPGQLDQYIRCWDTGILLYWLCSITWSLCSKRYILAECVTLLNIFTVTAYANISICF